jgi:hypothetical protein
LTAFEEEENAGTWEDEESSNEISESPRDVEVNRYNSTIHAEPIPGQPYSRWGPFQLPSFLLLCCAKCTDSGICPTWNLKVADVEFLGLMLCNIRGTNDTEASNLRKFKGYLIEFIEMYYLSKDSCLQSYLIYKM